MKAVILNEYGSVANFLLAEVETPVNGENSVLVQVKATAFNPIDYQMRQKLPESKLVKSAILGREFSGIVVEPGKKVTAFAAGDEVVAYVGSLASNGTYAELVSVPQELLVRKPPRLSFAEAAAIPMAGLTALQCVERLRLDQQQSVFIGGGAGGVGTMIIKLLLASGMTQLVTTAGSAESKTHLIHLGVRADNIIDYRQADIVQHILARNSSQPFDCCIDAVGGPLSEVCGAIIQVNGCYADITNLATERAKEQLFDKGTTILNISNYAYGLSGQASALGYYGQKLSHLFHLLEQGILTPLPIHLVGGFSAESVRVAHTLLEQNQTKGRKLVMTVA